MAAGTVLHITPTQLKDFDYDNVDRLDLSLLRLNCGQLSRYVPSASERPFADRQSDYLMVEEATYVVLLTSPLTELIEKLIRDRGFDFTEVPDLEKVSV